MEKINNFNNVKDVKLKNYNRAVMAFNLMDDAGEAVTRKYLEQFSDKDRHLIFIIIAAIKNLGVEKVYKQVTKDLTLEQNDNEEVVDA